MSPRRIVLLIGDGPGRAADSVLSGESSDLRKLLADEPDARVDVLAYRLERAIDGASKRRDLGADSPAVDRLLRVAGIHALQRRLSGFPLGRLLNSMGPLDPRRVFWRAVRRDPAARRMLRDADILVAGDMAATTTAWRALRRRWVAAAVYDHRAAGLTDLSR
jgi:hypothetical protein